MFPLMMNSNVKADIGNITIEDFEDLGDVDNSVNHTGNYLTFTNVSGSGRTTEPTFQLQYGESGATGDFCYEIRTGSPDVPQGEQIGNISFNSGETYFSSFSMKVQFGSGVDDIRMYFYDDSGTNWFTWTFSTSYSYFTQEGGSGFSTGAGWWYYCNFTHVSGNIFNATSYKIATQTEEYRQGSVPVSETWDTSCGISYIVIKADDNDDSDMYLFIDDIVINTNENSETAYPQIDGVTMAINRDNSSRTACPDVATFFSFTGFGDDGLEMYITIKDPTDGWVWTGWNPKSYPTITIYKQLRVLGNYTVNVYNAYDPTTVIFTDTFEVVACDGIDFSDLYGDFYAEFYTDGSSCFYHNNDVPRVAYKFMDITNYSTTNGKYILDIVALFNDENTTVYTATFNNGTYENNYLVSPISLSTKYWYRIYVYNTTESGGMYYRNEIIYTSSDLVVCIEGDNDGDGHVDYTDDTDSYDILPQLDSRIGIVVGFIITIFCTLSPMIVAGLINSNARTSINVPPTAYAITGALGVVVSVGLGFFPSWIIFFIVAVGIIISVFMYLNGNRGG